MADVYDRSLAKVCISQAWLCLLEGVVILCFCEKAAYLLIEYSKCAKHK